MGIKIDNLICKGCGACLYVCPVSVLEIEDMKAVVREGCISCGKCVEACTFKAITLDKPTHKPAKKKDLK